MITFWIEVSEVRKSVTVLTQPSPLLYYDINKSQILHTMNSEHSEYMNYSHSFVLGFSWAAPSVALDSQFLVTSVQMRPKEQL